MVTDARAVKPEASLVQSGPDKVTVHPVRLSSHSVRVPVPAVCDRLPTGGAMGPTSSATGTMTDDWCRQNFDHLAPEVALDLPGALARMRSLCPVAHSEQYGGFWVVTRYEDVLRVAQDWETFSSASGLTVPVAP